LSINETADGMVARLDYRADRLAQWIRRRLSGN
jgi:hypothetical protein